MLVLSRKEGQVVRIGSEIVVTVLRVERGKVAIGFEAPDGTVILRQELIRPTEEGLENA